MKLDAKTLVGCFVRLEPLEPRHYEGLKRAIEADQEIWQLYPFDMRGKHFDAWAERTAANMARGDAIAYAVLHGGAVIGVSVFVVIDTPNRRVEMGNTYYRPDMRGGMVNPESKFLMLQQAFDSGVHCVQLRVDASNARSRAAVTKLGAKQDGILRQDRITWTGRTRDTVIFSILSEEWPDVRAKLLARLSA
ncbi:MAG TPA: GNAT family protein [Rhizomicrobium sp.]|nr:GNAT family protein [Rhizomicrobium sp.]